MGAYRWPRLRDLPEAERATFTKHLAGQTVPIEPSLPDTEEEQDFYYAADYQRWRDLARTGEIWD